MIKRATIAIAQAAVAIIAFAGWADAQGLELVANLPAYRLDVFQAGERIRSYPAVIGLPRYPTPTGRYTLTEITWNPWWDPPDSRWAEGEKRTPPGAGNPMGRAKIQFDRLFYIHGTSGAVGRAASHGCIRVANADVLDLARLLAGDGGSGIEAEEIEELEQNPKRTRSVSLPPAVRIDIVYRLVEEVDGEVREYHDVYGFGIIAAERELQSRPR